MAVPGLKTRALRVKEMNQTKLPENRAYKVTLIVLVGLAAFSTAMRDLNRLQEIVGSIREFTGQWRGTDRVMLNVESLSTNELCPSNSTQLINSSAETSSGEGIPLAASIEDERFDCETFPEPEVGGNVELVASRKAKLHVPRLARANHAPARNLKSEEISAQRRDSHWPARFEYKTLDRIVTSDLPMTMLTDIKTDAFEIEVSPDFLLSLPGAPNRQHSPDRTHSGKREFMLMLKRFERNSSRRVS